MATVQMIESSVLKLTKLADDILDRIPPEYTQNAQRCLYFRARYQKYVLLVIAAFFFSLLMLSQIQGQQRLEELQETEVDIMQQVQPDEDMPEDIEREVVEVPKVFKWNPSVGESHYKRLFYNQRAMWDITQGKSSIEKVNPYSNPNSACKREFNTELEINIIIDVSAITVPLVPFTIGSVLKACPKVPHIYIIQDGSVKDDYMKKVEELIWEESKVEVLRTTGQGIASARNEALQKASGELIIFVSASVLVGEGWMEPLLEHLIAEPSTIVVPTYDRVDYWADNAWVITNPYTTINTVRTDMNVHLFPLYNYPDNPPVINSPAVRGDVMAVKKSDFVFLGGYDESLQSHGAAHTELSMRRWLCQGSVKTVRCSRVAICTVGEQRLQTVDEALYISELWTPKSSPNADPKVMVAAKKRATQRMTKILGCTKPGSWFTSHLVPNPADVHVSEDTVKFTGKIKVDTGVCIIPRANGVTFLGDCDHGKYGLTPKELEFKYTKFGYITFGDNLCLTTGGSGEGETQVLNLDTCVSGESRQRWAYSEKRVLKSIKGGCLKETTNPKNKNEEITDRIPCEYIYDGWGGIKLVRWEFVPVE